MTAVVCLWIVAASAALHFVLLKRQLDAHWTEHSAGGEFRGAGECRHDGRVEPYGDWAQLWCQPRQHADVGARRVELWDGSVGFGHVSAVCRGGRGWQPSLCCSDGVWRCGNTNGHVQLRRSGNLNLVGLVGCGRNGRATDVGINRVRVPVARTHEVMFRIILAGFVCQGRQLALSASSTQRSLRATA